MANVQSASVFESLPSMPSGQKYRFLAYISASMGAQCSENEMITEDMLRSWGVRWVFLIEHPIGTVVGTGFILRPSGTSTDFVLSGLCYDTGMLQSAHRILEAAVKIRTDHFPSHNLVMDLARDNTEIQSVAEKFEFSPESSGSQDVWIRYCLQFEAEPQISRELPPIEPELKHTDGDFSCGQCSNMFETNKSLQQHSVVHSDDRQYSCNHCDTKFKTKGGLKRHIQYAHTREKNFECNECQKRFVTTTLLSKHVKSVHPAQRNFECNQCGKRFKTRNTLKLHNLVHSETRPYSCNKCDKKFKTQSNLTQHGLVHLDSRPYSCDLCDKRFKTRTALKPHSAMHSENRPYSCDQCDQRFKTRTALKLHSVVHSDNHTYSCNQCDTKFKRNSGLKSHLQYAHFSEKNFECSECQKLFATTT
eukprot:465414_1